MKKLLALVMSLCMLLTAAAFAEESETVAINWADFEEAAASVEGQFTKISDIGIMMYIPADFKDTEISEEALNAGTFFVLQSQTEEKALVSGVMTQVDISSFATAVAQQGIAVKLVNVNGLNGIQFAQAIDGIVTISFGFGTDAGATILLSFSYPQETPDPFTDLYRMMAASIQAAPAE